MAQSKDKIPAEAKSVHMQMKPNYPINFIRPSFETTIQFINPGKMDITKPLPTSEAIMMSQSGAANDLLGRIDDTVTEDDAYNYSVEKGRNFLIIGLKQPKVVNQFAFFNASSEGSYRIYTSTTPQPPVGGNWMPAGPDVTFRSKGVSILKFPPTETSFVKVEFDVTLRGKISSLYLAGMESQLTYSFDEPPDESQISQAISPQSSIPAAHDPAKEAAKKKVDLNVGGLHAGTRVLYSSSSWEYGDPNQILSDIPQSAYAFSPRDKQPMLVMDFKKSRRLTKSTSRLTAAPGQMNIYLLEALPQSPASASGAALRASGEGFLPVSLRALAPYRRISVGGGANPLALALQGMRPTKSLPLDQAANAARVSPSMDGASGRFLIFQFVPKIPGGPPFVPQKLQLFTKMPPVPPQMKVVPPAVITPQEDTPSGRGIAEAGTYYVIDADGKVRPISANELPPEVAEMLGLSLAPQNDATMSETASQSVNDTPTPSTTTTVPNLGAPGVNQVVIPVEPPVIEPDPDTDEDSGDTTTPTNPSPSP